MRKLTLPLFPFKLKARKVQGMMVQSDPNKKTFLARVDAMIISSNRFI